MLAIEEQIKALQRIKAKIELYQKVSLTITDEAKLKTESTKKLDLEYPGLLQEFCDEICTFCADQMRSLGRGPLVYAKANPEPQIVKPEPVVNPDVIPQAEMDEPTDPLRFLLKYKAWEGKKVSFPSKDGQVNGTVRGMVVPYLKVETDTGFVIDVKPKELKVL